MGRLFVFQLKSLTYHCISLKIGYDAGELINISMAKRSTGVEKGKKSHSRKTAKRLETKRVMLEKKGLQGRYKKGK